MRKTLIALVLPILILLAWSLLTSFNIIPAYILPSPDDVLNSFLALLGTNELFIDTIATLSRVLTGLLIASVIAIPLGIIMGWSKKVENISNLTVQILRPIPPLAWIPFAMLWFGLGFQSAVFIIFIGTFFPVLLNTIDGVKRINKVFIESAYTLGASERQVLSNVIMPASLPSIFTGLRVGIGIGLMCTVAAEMIAVKSGLGYLIMQSMNLINTGAVIVGMLIIGIIGFIMDYSFRRAEKKYVLWSGNK
ncbi:MAG: ABC transporter permease [Methanobacterium sp.]